MAVTAEIAIPVTVQSATCTPAFQRMALSPTFQAGQTHTKAHLSNLIINTYIIK